MAEGLNSCSSKEISEKVLNLDFYGVRGAAASRRVAAYLIYQFLREQDKTLEYPEDAKEVKYLLDPTLAHVKLKIEINGYQNLMTRYY